MSHIKLTKREEKILDLLLQSYTNDEIAKELGIARRTVKSYFNRLFLKYGITDHRYIKRVVLAVMVYQQRRKERDGLDMGNIDGDDV